MGAWAVPSTHEKVAILEHDMTSGISAGRARDELYYVIGNDTLWDMLDDLDHHTPTADVRPLIAAYLEELARWSLPSDFLHPWELGVKEKLAFLAGRFEHEALPPFWKLAVADDPDAACSKVEEILGDPTDGEGTRNFVARRIAPGVYAVDYPAADRLYRVECRYGLVIEAREELRSELREAIFQENAPRPH